MTRNKKKQQIPIPKYNVIVSFLLACNIKKNANVLFFNTGFFCVNDGSASQTSDG